MGLEQLGGEPEAGFAGAAGADDTGVEVPGVGRVLGLGVGGEKFRFSENDVIFKLGIGKRGNIFWPAPTGRSILRIRAEFLGLFRLAVNQKPDASRPRDAYQPVKGVQPWREVRREYSEKQPVMASACFALNNSRYLPFSTRLMA